MIEYFLDPYPEELLYSVCARVSDQVQYPNRKDVLHELFGKDDAIPVVDLPCYLGYLVDNLPFGHTYTVDSLLNQHTLFPFYAPFLPQDRRQRLCEQMISSNAYGIHRLIGNTGNVASKLSLPPWFRYCPTCVEEDRARYGECYWHRLHQIRGVEVCPSHKTYLENSNARTQRDARLEVGRLITAEQVIPSSIPRIVISSPLNNFLIDIARAASTLSQYRYIPSDDDFIRRQYGALLAQRSLMTPSGLVRTTDFLHAFASYYPPELLSLLHCEVKLNDKSMSSWLSTIMRPSAGSRHPLHHILIIHFLGSKVETFLSQEISSPRPFGNGPWPCLNPVCEYYHQRRIDTCQIHEANGKGHLVGNFTCSCGFIYSRSGPDHSSEDLFRRDKILAYGPLWEAMLRELWTNPDISCRGIASKLGVDFTTINRQASKLHLPFPRIASQTPRLRTKSTKRDSKDQSWYREQWTRHVATNPEEGIKTLRERLPGVYGWLMSHDKEWLMAHRPLPRQRQKRQDKIPHLFQSSSPDFLEVVMTTRDIEKAAAIRSCAQRIVDDLGYPKRVTKRKISVDIPGLRQLKPDEFPIAMLALQEVVETTETFALRRIQWFVNKCQEEKILPKRQEFIDEVNIARTLHIPSVQRAFDEAMTILSSL